MRRAIVPAFLIAATPAVAAQQETDVRFLYDQVAPETCLGDGVRPEWHMELKGRLPEFLSLWREHGPHMVQQVQRITGKSFAIASKVALTLCATPSNSFLGPTVNMRYALRSFTSSPVPMRYKVDTAPRVRIVVASIEQPRGRR
jgi:hypothetical protein